MITDDDVLKLLNAFKSVFTTKSDLKAMEDRQDKKYASKGNLKSELKAMEDRLDQKFVTKDDLKKSLKDQTEDIVTAVGTYVADTIVPMFESRDKKIDRIEKKLNLPPLAD